MRKVFSTMTFLATVLALALGAPAQAADVTYCTVTTGNDTPANSDLNYSGYFRYWIEDVIPDGAGWNACKAPTGSSDAKIGEFGSLVMFETTEFTGSTQKDIDYVTLDRAVNTKRLSAVVGVGNWTPEMLTDVSQVDYTGYVEFTKDYGSVVIDAHTKFDANEQPFNCDEGEQNIAMRNVILYTNGVKKEDVVCVKDAGAYEVCEGELIPASEIPSGISTGGKTPKVGTPRISDMTSRTMTPVIGDIRVMDNGIAGILHGSGNTTGEDKVTYEKYNDEWACKRSVPAEICNDAIDNDGDGATDCDDSDCANDDACSTGAPDADGDGYDDTTDCDDNDATVNPGATEICDGKDNDCDGATDEDVMTTYYPDADGDTYGDVVDTGTAACTQPTGFVTDHTDCLDSDATVNPVGVEVCGDSIDQDCSGADLSCTTTTDADGDGYDTTTDCNDADATVHPGATDSCADGTDQDCSGADSTVSCTASTEICDGIDNNENGTIDEEYPDSDADGIADCVDVEACDGTDNDGDGSIDEGFDVNEDGLADCIEFGNEQCSDGVDNDGDGSSDCDDIDCDSDTSCNGKTAETSCDDSEDNDADGFTDCNDSDCGTDSACLPTDDDNDGFDTTVDCNDAEASINPNASESCTDGADNNCDGKTNEGCTVGTPEVDDDGDQYCDDANLDGVCTDGSLAGDCDDSNADINPGATESSADADLMCGDDVDQNCDGLDAVCDSSELPIGNGALVGGGCGCDLKAQSQPQGRDMVQALMALVPMVAAFGLRRRAAKKNS